MSRAKQKTRLRRSRGFTLVELLVAMVAGLIVSLAIVAISRETTNTFHEEMRSASAEMSTRTALDRIKNDLQRAGYMSTGNFMTDPRIPLDPAGNRANGASPQLLALAGIRYDLNGTRAGTAAQTPLSTAGDNALNPDAIEISGNFTSSDVFVVSRISDGAGCLGGPRLWLSMDSAATYRVLATTNPGRTIQEMFTPVTSDANPQFMIRVADDLGRHQIVHTCAGASAGYDDGEKALYVDLGQAIPYLTSAYGFVDGRITVNPVQMIRYEIRPLTSSDTSYSALLTDPGADGGVSTKYNLVRSYIDQNMAVIPQRSEVIAEFAVDLEFAFTFDRGNYTNSPPAPLFESYAFGAAQNATYADNVPGAVPERIRSVRVRFSTRSSVADRIADFRVSATNQYTVRYCLNPAGCTPGSRDWARVRTMTTEVSLPNHARHFY
jgi:prepilin-type N-terminal cleavage/methylation domain-containing protein